MVSAVSLATIELLGTQSAYSTKRDGAKARDHVPDDGQPTLPLENSQLQNAKMAIQQAVRAAKLDVRIDTFAIGEDALSEPVVVVEMARVTDGVFTPVRNPKDVRAVFEEVSFSDIETLEVKNKTTGAAASQLISNADGSFSALLDMKEGDNTIEVFARSTDGTEGRREVNVKFLAGAKTQELSRAWSRSAIACSRTAFSTCSGAASRSRPRPTRTCGASFRSRSSRSARRRRRRCAGSSSSTSRRTPGRRAREGRRALPLLEQLPPLLRVGAKALAAWPASSPAGPRSS